MLARRILLALAVVTAAAIGLAYLCADVAPIQAPGMHKDARADRPVAPILGAVNDGLTTDGRQESLPARASHSDGGKSGDSPTQISEVEAYLRGSKSVSGARVAAIIVGCEKWDSVMDVVYKRRLQLDPAAAKEFTTVMEAQSRECQSVTNEHRKQLPWIARRAFEDREPGAAQMLLVHASNSIRSDDLARISADVLADFRSCERYSWSFVFNPLVDSTNIEKMAAILVKRHQTPDPQGGHADQDRWQQEASAEGLEAAQKLAAEVISRCKDRPPVKSGN